MNIDKKRFDEMSNFGYKWYGMYPIHTLKEFRNLIIKHPQSQLYELHSDDSESEINQETMLNQLINGHDNILAVDITKIFTNIPAKDYNDLEKIKAHFDTQNI